MNENKNDILYKPSIEYQKNYDTEGTLYRDSEDDIQSETGKSPVEDLNKKLEDIKKILPLLPEDLQQVIKNPMDAIQHVIGEIPENIEKPKDKEEVIPEIPVPEDKDDGDDSEDFVPESPFDDNRKPIEIEIVNNEKSEIIKEEYEYDLISVISDYIDKLNIVTNKYWENLLTSFKGRDPKDFIKVLAYYNIETEKVSNDYRHLSDTIIKSQISRNMKQRLYLKLFDIDGTISHIRACKAGVEQRVRYYTIPYQPSTNFNSMVSNKILAENRKVYDSKYKQNFFNLYKYLNSSVILFNECLNMFISEAQAKIILIDKEGDKISW